MADLGRGRILLVGAGKAANPAVPGAMPHNSTNQAFSTVDNLVHKVGLVIGMIELVCTRRKPSRPLASSTLPSLPATLCFAEHRLFQHSIVVVARMCPVRLFHWSWLGTSPFCLSPCRSCCFDAQPKDLTFRVLRHTMKLHICTCVAPHVQLTIPAVAQVHTVPQ
eukprot:642-Amphidinium_carterae.1